MTIFYAGIGSRQTPEPVLRKIAEVAELLGRQGLVLRSGAAEGADKAFEAGAVIAQEAPSCGPAPEIYIPWPGFNGSQSTLFDMPRRARDIAATHHPAWLGLSDSARRMHTRNVAQVLGQDCETPSSFVLCWTPGGKGKGGTGQALRVARAYGIPVYDMALFSRPYIRRELQTNFGVTI